MNLDEWAEWPHGFKDMVDKLQLKIKKRGQLTVVSFPNRKDNFWHSLFKKQKEKK